MILLTIPSTTTDAVDGVKYIDENGDEQIRNGVTEYAFISGSSAPDLANGWYLFSGNVANMNQLKISGTDVNIILKDGCDLGFVGSPAIRVLEGTGLTIYAQSTGSSMGILNANAYHLVSSLRGAGIGSDADQTAGMIKICGGTIVAYGGNNGGGAGIGGGYRGNGGTTIITGGNVTAIGGNIAAGIGGGGDNSGSPTAGKSGNILIYGDNTKVTAKKGPAPGDQEDIGIGINGKAGGDIFVLLPVGNLIGTSGQLGNTVKFTATPETTTGTVVATLPAPLSSIKPTINVLTGLDPTGKNMSVLTNLTSQTVYFALEQYGNSPLSKTGNELLQSGVSVDFRDPFYLVYVTIVNNGYVDLLDEGDNIIESVTAQGLTVVEVPHTVSQIKFNATGGIGYYFEKYTSNLLDIFNNPYTCVNGNMAITAYFQEKPRVTLTLESYPSPSGTFQYRLSGESTWQTYTSPTDFYEGDLVEVMATPISGYAFRFWEDAYASNIRTYTINANATLTAYFLSTSASNTVIITLTSSPLGAGTFTWSLPGMTTTIPYSVPFITNKRDDLTVIAEEASGYTFRMWDNSSTATTRNVGTHTTDMEYTAFFLGSTGNVTLVLTAYPALSGTFEYKLSGTTSWQTYSSPVNFNAGDSVDVRATPSSGYLFQFWEDASTSSMRTYVINTDSVLTAYFLSTNPSNTAGITLTSSPLGAGTFIWSLPGMTTPNTYAGPFFVNKTDDLTIIASAATDYTFRFWEDATTAATRNVGPQSADAEYTAYFLTDIAGDKVEITLTASPAAAGTFEWSLPGMTTPNTYAGPFFVNKTDDLTIIASAATDYTFRFWEDATTAATRNVGPQSADAEYTAYFLTDIAGDKVEITLTASPAAAGTFKWSLPGMTTPNTYAGPFFVNKTDDLTIIASAATDYTFRFWEDATTAATRNVGPQSADAEYTAYFLTDIAGDKVEITLTASPAAAGTFTWSLPGMTTTIPYTIPFEVNKSDDLTVITAPTGTYTFVNWDDSSISLSRNVGLHTADTEYTAYFLGSSTVTLTLEAYPASSATFEYRITGTAGWTAYTGVVTLNTGESVDIQFTAATDYTFRFWEDASTTAARTYVVNTDSVLTAYFLTDIAGDKVEITLTASPAAAGTFEWSLPGMTTPNTYAGPFFVNKTDDL
ncbi:MAG: hypothetical protein FWG41_03395, partial [Methanomassiliicoccaceae archaeon]|nr:hypothetical protein [Methanomassiliicoccaceae archaeon]